MAIWVPSVANQSKEAETSDSRNIARGCSSIVPVEDKDVGWRRVNNGDDRELSVMENSAYFETVKEDILLEDLKVLHLFPFLLRHKMKGEKNRIFQLLDWPLFLLVLSKADFFGYIIIFRLLHTLNHALLFVVRFLRPCQRTM